MPKIQPPEDEDEFPHDDLDDPTGSAARRHELWQRPTAAGIIRRPITASSWAGDPDSAEDDDYSDYVADDDVDEAAPAIQVPGHHVMDRAAIDEAIAASCFDGSLDHLSNGEAERVRLLLHYRKTVPLFRRHVIGDAAMIVRLEQLGAVSPNFAAVTGLVLRAAHLSSVSGCPLRIPPVLMLGPPGIGKTRYARALATALATSLEVVTGSTVPDVGSLTGYPPIWRGAGPGRVAKAIIAAPTSGPLVFTDECEKIVDREAGARPLDRLLTLLEPQSAACFEDEHLRIPMRADRVLWLFACNSLDGLSAPFRDRVVIVSVPGLSPAQRDAVLDIMLTEVAQELGVRVSLADLAALTPLRALGLRRCRLAFEIAIPCAIAQDRRFITAADLAEAVALLRAEGRTPIGFFPAGLSSLD